MTTSSRANLRSAAAATDTSRREVEGPEQPVRARRAVRQKTADRMVAVTSATGPPGSGPVRVEEGERQVALGDGHDVTVAVEDVEEAAVAALRVVGVIVDVGERHPGAARGGDLGVGAAGRAAVVPDNRDVGRAVAVDEFD